MSVHVYRNFRGFRGMQMINYKTIPTHTEHGMTVSDLAYLDNWTFIGKLKSVGHYLKCHHPPSRHYFRTVHDGDAAPLVIDIMPLAKGAADEYADAIRKAPLELLEGAAEVAATLAEGMSEVLEYRSPVAPKRMVRITCGEPSGRKVGRRRVISAEDQKLNGPTGLGSGVSFETIRRALKGEEKLWD